MKEIHVDNLIFCPLCGHEPVMHRNSGDRFRVSCPLCGAHTDWLSKTNALIAWYNLHFSLHTHRFLKQNPLVRLGGFDA